MKFLIFFSFFLGRVDSKRDGKRTWERCYNILIRTFVIEEISSRKERLIGKGFFANEINLIRGLGSP